VRHLRMLGLCLVAACAVSAVVAGSALAENLEQYKQCPLKDPLVKFCIYGAATSGYYTVGPITVPIEKPIVLQGGGYRTGIGNEEAFILPANGQAIVPTPETVPGEPLANVTPAEQKEFGWTPELEKSYENARIKGLLGPGTITEIIETAGVPETNKVNIVFEEGDGVIAPIKITGKNKWLEKLGGKGGNCKIGSPQEPIVQHLTSGTSTSPLTGETIRGTAGELEIFDEGNLARLTGTSLVDNTYSVPAAHGCGGGRYEGYLDPLVDRAFGLPQPAGASVTVLDGLFELAGAGFVKKELKG
jgi:hypothetical protein